MNFTQRQKLVCNSQRVYPRPPNILHLLCIWVKCAGVWGKITPMKWTVFIMLYPMWKARMSLSKFLPQTSKKFTQIYLSYLWHFATLNKPLILMHVSTKRRFCYEQTELILGVGKTFLVLSFTRCPWLELWSGVEWGGGAVRCAAGLQEKQDLSKTTSKKHQTSLLPNN